MCQMTYDKKMLYNSDADVKSPQCPYCFDGEIIFSKDNEVFICNRCRRKVLMLNR